ncbi:hypothetical protein T02_16168 [Trichinella nativa]|uniref:Uncharacterized protein n=1 Tax=Trichinella nativa TaxID=6335 RepID=A0A0V1KSZ1_9BILA|nr:hypothetical protein T02_16168 [Trichinella nativa]
MLLQHGNLLKWTIKSTAQQQNRPIRRHSTLKHQKQQFSLYSETGKMQYPNWWQFSLKIITL